MNKKNKAQIQQVFIYILAVIIFAVVFYFGFKAVKDFLGKGQQIAAIQFKNEIESLFERLQNNYGSVEVFNAENQFKAPPTVEAIYFFNTLNRNCGSIGYEGAEDACSSGYKLFIKGKYPIDASEFKLPELSTPGGYTLIKSKAGLLCFRAEGKGRYVYVENITC